MEISFYFKWNASFWFPWRCVGFRLFFWGPVRCYHPNYQVDDASIFLFPLDATWKNRKIFQNKKKKKKKVPKRSLPRLLNKRQQFHLDVTWTKHSPPFPPPLPVKRLLIFCPQRRSGPASFTQFNRWPDCQTKQITKSQRINSINYTQGQKIIKPHTRRFFSVCLARAKWPTGSSWFHSRIEQIHGCCLITKGSTREIKSENVTPSSWLHSIFV